MVETRTEEKPYTYYCLEPDMNKNMKQFLNFEKIKEELGKPSIYIHTHTHTQIGRAHV